MAGIEESKHGTAQAGMEAASLEQSGPVAPEQGLGVSDELKSIEVVEETTLVVDEVEETRFEELGSEDISETEELLEEYLEDAKDDDEEGDTDVLVVLITGELEGVMETLDVVVAETLLQGVIGLAVTQEHNAPAAFRTPIASVKGQSARTHP